MFWPQYLKNQKSLLYNLPQISFWATCISEIFDFGPIEDLLLHNVFLILFLCYCLHKVTFCIHFWKKRKKFDFFSIVFEFPIKFWSRKTVWVLNRVLKIVLDACFVPKPCLETWNMSYQGLGLGEGGHPIVVLGHICRNLGHTYSTRLSVIMVPFSKVADITSKHFLNYGYKFTPVWINF